MKKKVYIKLLRLPFICMVLLFNCTNKKVVVPANKQNDIAIAPCDTINVSYSCVVKPILQNNCYSCHSTSLTSSGGLDLENFQSLKKYLNLYYRNDSIYGSKFYNIVLQTPGTLSMPPTYKLLPKELRLLKKWIDLGALPN